MAERQPLDAAIAALRYALACLDEVERQDRGAQPSTAARFTMPLDAMPALADMVVAARCALAEHMGIGEPVAQRQFARQLLESELETHTLAAQEAGLAETAPVPVPLPEQLLAPEHGLDPQLAAAVWEFVAAARTGTAKRSRRDSEIAAYLAGRWEMAMAGVYAATGGISLEEGRAKVAELIEAQRAIYGSLAAGERRTAAALR